MTLTSTRRLAVILLGLGLPLAAQAQPPAPGAAAPAKPPAGTAAAVAPNDPAKPGTQTAAGTSTRGGRAAREAAMTDAQIAARVEAHLTQLRTQLGIAAPQQVAWDRFAQTSRDNAAELHRRFQQRGGALPTANAAENMADFAQVSELHAQQLARLATSFRALYETMAPEQQRSADAIFRTNRVPAAALRG